MKSHYINNFNQSACYLIGTCLPAMHIPFSTLFISLMSSIPAHQVPTILQVPIQVTQHKDDTNPSCISSVLFRVLVIILHSSHPTKGRYPVPLLAVSPLGCFTKLRHLHYCTPPQLLEVILFTKFPTHVTVL